MWGVGAGEEALGTLWDYVSPFKGLYLLGYSPLLTKTTGYGTPHEIPWFAARSISSTRK